jgi:hypothetical protein
MTSDDLKIAGGPRSRSPAERMSLYRKRQRRRQRCIRIQIGVPEITALVEKGYLDPAERENVESLEFAASSFIADSLRSF